MSNQTLLNCSFSQELPSLDQLLDSLGFDAWKTILSSIFLPIINFIGIFLCSLSLWIFFYKNFKDPVFFYYRLLCVVYIIHLLLNIPKSFLFSPRYFPKINTYYSSIYFIFYATVSGLLFHFEETLQMAILLTRMSIYNSFVKEHFKAKPWKISLGFFFTCVLINISSVLAVKVDSFGTYHYIDTNGVKKKDIFYFFSSTEFSFTPFGKILFGFTFFFLNLFLSIIAGVTLNLVSVHLYRSYVKERREKCEAYTRVAYSHRNQEQIHTTTNGDINRIEKVISVSKPKSLPQKRLTQKEINEDKAERNMLKMALTQISISILSRVLFIFCFISFLYLSSFSNGLIINIVTVSMYTIIPTTSIFIFYSFNKMFRDEFRKNFSIQEKSKSTTIQKDNFLDKYNSIDKKKGQS